MCPEGFFKFCEVLNALCIGINCEKPYCSHVDILGFQGSREVRKFYFNFLGLQEKS